MSIMRRFVLGPLALLLLASLAPAAVRIDVGAVPLAPDTPAQTFPIYVTGGDAVQGVNFNLQVGDGGPEAGGTAGPRITAVDLITGTIFAANHAAPINNGSLPQMAMWSLTTQNGTVAASGLLATVTVDTTGFSNRSFALWMKNTLNGTTDFGPDANNVTIVPTIVNGTIQVPEPAGLAALALLMAMMSRRPRPRQP